MNQQYFAALKEIKETDVKVLLKKSYRGIWETAIKKYSDSAHFIYELLQNADDTQATWVQFDLKNEGLWFKHNGSVRFTISDPENEEFDSENGTLGHINSITSIGNSTKSDGNIDEQKIGKFGIGFKAVFAYSNTPHVYDDSFTFKLENYIVPVEITPNGEERNSGETLFFFPFNHKSKAPEDAYKEIETKLDNLFQPILFLSNLEKIEWKSENNQGIYNKKEKDTQEFGNITAQLFEVISNENGKVISEEIWLFTKQIIQTSSKATFKISTGFFVLENNTKLETGYNYEAFCFFPTKEDTKLGFIVQAPFLLTDSREGIKTNDDWNTFLIQLLAELSGEAIKLLKDIGVKNSSNLIDDTLLDIIPYNAQVYSQTGVNSRISFYPFFTEIKKALQNHPILPGRNGKYFPKAKAYWAADPELSELFTNEQLSDLFDNPNSGWVFVSKGQKQVNQANKALESYINSIISESVDAKKLIRRFTPAFIEKQSDDWLIKLYAYLADHKYLWNDNDKLAIKQPLLLNQSRKAVIPFNKDLTAPQIFLPLERVSSYDTVYQPLVDNPDALAFITAIGIGKPDIKAEIFNDIIPQYHETFNYDDSVKILQHFETFLNYYESCSAIHQIELVTKLKEVSLIACYNPQKPDTRFFAKPEEIYFNDEKLVKYHSNTLEVYFVDDDFYIEYLSGAKAEITKKLFSELGVSLYPRIKNKELEPDVETKEMFGLDNILTSYKYHEHQKITDKELEGLDQAVSNITPELSVVIWDYLLHFAKGQTVALLKGRFSGRFTYYPRSGSYENSMSFISTTSSILQNDKWLLNKDEEFVAASELSIEDLNECYNHDDPYIHVLLEFLGIINPDADLDLTDEQKKAYELGKKLLAENITPEELSAFIEEMARKKSAAEPAGTLFPTNEIPVTEHDFQKTLSNINKGIKKNRKQRLELNINETDQFKNQIPSQSNIDFVEQEEFLIDQDDYTKPSVNLQKKIEKLKLQAEAQVEELTRIEKLTELADSSEKYSFGWFKALLELEYLNSSESNSSGKQISIQFSKVEQEKGTERTLVLKHPNRYIPQSIEDIGDMQIRLYQGDETKSVTVEVVSVKEYTLRAKLKKSADISDIDLAKVSRAVIDIKNPVFILEELRKAFYRLGFEDDYNLQQNITEQIRFIFGPPGTGKTTYLATDEIIPLMQENENLKVLVLTPTNKAADVLTNRIVEKMKGDKSYHNWLLRFGTACDTELENSGLVVDKSFDIRTKPKNTTITTIARFAYDYFQPDVFDERLHLKFLEWDYIVIDEASMITIASIAYVLYQKSNSKFIIAGDPFQIQPITQIDQWKDLNIYEMVQLTKFVNPVTVPHQFEIINLSTQYRSLPTIGEVFSQFTYSGCLNHYRDRSSQKALNISGLDFRDINIIKFPVQKYESIYKPNTLNKSNYQVYSALFTVEFATQLVDQIRLNHKDKFKIGIICPYRAQATMIEKLLARLHDDDEKAELLTGTIHGFQGDECDIIISVFNPPYSIGKSQNMFLNKQNILNVAISRAKDYLFILMPDDMTQDIENLYRIKRIERLANQYSAGRISVYETEIVEEKLLGSSTYIYDNSFATTHQSVNVYSKPEKKYEIRCEEIAIDVQMKH
ncbi:AAA domain-containing protein [Chryseobacterium sp.]|uniref:DEAD/DEAH box helicase n=1 Tax=Chryseobacterium sp. TaxID=1871047 RepID=UPI0031CF543A